MKTREYSLLEYLLVKAWLKKCDCWRDDLLTGDFMDVIKYGERVRNDTTDEELLSSYPIR
jgi:hypothetical protein